VRYLSDNNERFMVNAQMVLFQSKYKIAFLEFHHKNPEVYELFKRFTFQVVNSGRHGYGARSLIERIRWHTNIETTDPDFKINNNHAPHYARMFMLEFPKHDKFFTTRETGTIE